MPLGREEVVTVSEGLMTMVSCLVAVCAVGVEESETFTVNVALPCIVGVPLMIPLDAPIFKLAGRAPALMEYANGAIPPVAETGLLYATPTVPAGRELVLMDGPAGFTLIVMFVDVADCAPAALESVTFTAKVEVPTGPDGVPVIAPVEAFSDRPAGNEPEL